MTVTLGRPLAASLLFAGLLSVALLAIAASFADLSSATDERDAKADLLARSVAASRRARLDAPDPGQGDPFVAAGSETLGAARVEALIRSTATDAGCAVLSSKAEVKPDDSGVPGRIEIQSIVEGTNDALQATLLRLETGAPTLLIDRLEMQPVDDAAAPAANLSADQQDPRLRLTLTISAFWKRP